MNLEYPHSFGSSLTKECEKETGCVDEILGITSRREDCIGDNDSRPLARCTGDDALMSLRDPASCSANTLMLVEYIIPCERRRLVETFDEWHLLIVERLWRRGVEKRRKLFSASFQFGKKLHSGKFYLTNVPCSYNGRSLINLIAGT